MYTLTTEGEAIFIPEANDSDKFSADGFDETGAPGASEPPENACEIRV